MHKNNNMLILQPCAWEEVGTENGCNNGHLYFERRSAGELPIDGKVKSCEPPTHSFKKCFIFLP